MHVSAKASFDVTAIVHYFQPTSTEVLEQTNRQGTAIISPNFLSFQRTGQTIEEQPERYIRDIWSQHARTKAKSGDDVSVGDAVLPHLITAAKQGVPSEYTVVLPLHGKFKRDPTYYSIQIRQANDASFQSVVSALIPFEALRRTILGIQEELIVPLHSIQIGFVPSNIPVKLVLGPLSRILH